MSNNEQNITDKHIELIGRLVAGDDVETAAKSIGVGYSTARRWLTFPKVREALTLARGEMAVEAIEDIKKMVTDRFEKLAPKALTALEQSVDQDDSPAVRLKAAQLVLDRVAPAQASTTAQQQQSPLQGQLIDPGLAAYLTFEELDAIEQIAAQAEQRRAQAESDRETLERKRG